jgi:hypothetical protein
MDLSTYIHHTVPYLLVSTLLSHEGKNREIICVNEYNNINLAYTYAWVYSWFVFIYIPWRIYTNDTVYSILDLKQTPKPIMIVFIIALHLIIYLSNITGYGVCKIMFYQ